MKVLKPFYCIVNKESYKKGDNYNGQREDLIGFVEYPKAKTIITKEEKVKYKSKK